MSDSDPGLAPKRALVIGASGGIGSALVMALGNLCGMSNVVTLSRAADGLDITNEASIATAAARLEGPFDLIFLATGGLEINGRGPEKALSQISPEALRDQFELNALGPALLIKHFQTFLPKSGRSILAVLTAKIGSIEDNRLGGWISYRAAKAAANQIVRTASIELQRTRPDAICVALHPGTVRTALTRKYAGSYTQTPPEEAATNLLSVLNGLSADQTGQFLDYRGEQLPW